MKTLLLLATLSLAADATREIVLAREMLEDAAIRNDEEGLRLTRERLIRIAAETDDKEAHYLIALAVRSELFSGNRDQAEKARLLATGLRHADRAVAIDDHYAAAWMIGSFLRGSAPFIGLPAPKTAAPGGVNGFRRALELDAEAPPIAFFNAMIRSINPAGPAPPEGRQLFEQLVARLDAGRAATGRRWGQWDVDAHAWLIMVRMAAASPDPAAERSAVARLVEQRPDADLAQQLAALVAERRFVDPGAVEWRAMATDPEGDGKSASLPDVVSFDTADGGDRLWTRVTFRETLPRSFGVNLVFDADGDPMTGATWWGSGSTLRFDRLVTAWITRDGDRYSGRVGVTDDDGARAARLTKLSANVLLAMGTDGRSLIVGVPKSVLGLTDRAVMIAAGGSHLVWNDDATGPAGAGVPVAMPAAATSVSNPR